MCDDRLTPEEYGKRLAEQTVREFEKAKPAIHMAAANQACLTRLVVLLIEKGILQPQETLDAFAKASDEIQLQPDSAIGVQVVEGLCSIVAGLPGAKRGSA